jgi:CheY-like chemotaxis protein
VRILFLDDAQLRHDVFARAHGMDDVVHAFTAAEATRALDEQARFDLVHLDHDLAEEHFLELSSGERETPAVGDSHFDPGTGMDVVRHIIAMPPERRPHKAVVHTHNPIGAEMTALLADQGVPSTWRKI